MRVRGNFCVRSFVVVYQASTNWRKRMQDDAEIGLVDTLDFNRRVELATNSCGRVRVYLVTTGVCGRFKIPTAPTARN